MDPTPLPTYDIDAILANRKNKDVVTALLEALHARGQACKSAQRIGFERDIYWLDLVHSGIFCDGINGTLLNYGLKPLVFAVGGFRRVGAVEKANILKEALRSFGEPEPGRELPTTYSLPPTPEQKKLFEELDQRFIHAKENFSELAATFIEMHVEEFRSYGTQAVLAQPPASPSARPVERPASSSARGGPPSVSSGAGIAPGEQTKRRGNLAFVLLSEPRLPDPQKLSEVFRSFASSDETIQVEPGGAEQPVRDMFLAIKHSTGESSFVTMLPVAVPNGEAERYVPFSASFFLNDWKLPTYRAHLVVAMQPGTESSPMVQLSRFTSLVGAITKASPAVGVYWGNAGATHSSEFFVSIASGSEVVLRIMLWSGVRLARENDGRLSLLSLGMNQLGLPELLMLAGPASADGALETMFQLLAYLASRGEALPEGDTVGSTADERWRVQYVPSPVDPTKKVCRLELP